MVAYESLKSWFFCAVGSDHRNRCDSGDNGNNGNDNAGDF